MAKISLSRAFILRSINGVRNGNKAIKINHLCYKGFATSMEAKEVQIPTSWGHIAGKLWGSDKQRPILALHGWQDNAGTWDALIPLLPPDCSVLAVDFPGHGKSSWYPEGMQYYPWEWPRSIQYIKDYYKWDKVSFLAHSMGSIAAMRYSILFPDMVDFYIGFENLIMNIFQMDYILHTLPKNMKKLQIEQQRLDKEPPSYPYEELLKRLHLGTGKSVAMESAHYLIDRGTKPSKLDPTKFYFSRDSRLKYVLCLPEDREFVRAFAATMRTPTLYVKATDSDYAADEFSVEIRNLLLKSNDKFECQFVPGTHHVHLNNPEVVAPIITEFLRKLNVVQDSVQCSKI